MQGVHLRKYGVETKINFELYEVDGVDLRIDAADAGSDCTVRKDQGADATCENDFVDEGLGYSLTLTATEMEAASITVYIIDSATKVWLDKVIVIETYGHASAQHALDLDDAVRGGMTALPNVAADAAGGLPISDAGELDLDTKLANTNEITAARMGALTDWINAGRLDAILDTIATDAARLTAVRAAVLTDLIDGGRLDSLIDAIKERSDNLPDAPADDSGIDSQLAAIAAYIDTEITTIIDAITALNNLSTAQVNAEVVDALNVDTYAEPGQEAPPATTTLVKKISYLYKFLRNKITNDGTDIKIYNDAKDTVDQKASVSEADGTVTRDEFGSGA